MPTLRTYSYAINDKAIAAGYQTLRGSHSIIPGKPVEVGSRRQHLMDRHVVDDVNGTFRTVHQPVKHPANPVITGDPEGDVEGPHSFGTVLREADTGTFRMWAGTTDREILERGGKKAIGSQPGVYYESDDGIEWRRPELGLFEHWGGKDNNVFCDHLMECVVALPEQMSDKGRYALMYQPIVDREQLPPDQNHMRKNFAFSDDGIRFTDIDENPVLQGRSDTNNCIVYNPERDVFMHYRRSTVNAGEIRRIAYTESEDLISWTQPVTIIARDEIDPLYLYGMPVSRYNDMYLGYLFCLWSSAKEDEFVGNGKDYKMDTQLAWSRDGINWDRHPQRPTFIPNSPPRDGALDWGMAQGMASAIEVGDEVYVYYGGRPYLHSPGVARDKHDRPRSIMLATLQRDRFVSIDATDDGGYMLTKPVTYPGGKLHINARTTTPDGFVRVAVREAHGVRDGEWVADFRFEKSQPFSGDSLDAVLTWEGHETLGAFPSTVLRLQFWMESAELYSFWFE